tara:strand:- start:6448 stop:6765 length:318 start_codon:yes stop_codon:yes gene_type:complete
VTKEQFDNFLSTVFNRTIKMFNCKRDEYACNDDVFRSFRLGTGFSIHDEPAQVAYEYLCKHLESIRTMVKNCEENVESTEYIEEKIGDAINYLIIIEGLLKEKNK